MKIVSHEKHDKNPSHFPHDARGVYHTLSNLGIESDFYFAATLQINVMGRTLRGDRRPPRPPAKPLRYLLYYKIIYILDNIYSIISVA